MKTAAEKNKAFDLRKNGQSYGRIADILNISKSTVSLWFKNVNWSKNIKRSLIEKSKIASRKRLIELNDLRKRKLDDLYVDAEKEAITEYQHIKNDKLFITAISLYWGEGDKVFKNGIVRISNIDERLLWAFNDFLRIICRVNINKIRAGILLYPDLDADECLKFWSKNIKISKDRFFKPTVIQGKHKINKVGNGVCIVSVHDKYLKRKMLVWLDLFRREF
jgi:predicted transcriptional regulator